MSPQPTISTTSAPRARITPASPVRDAMGCPIFAAGEMGTAHVIAHQLFDESRFAEGRHWLDDWLASHTDSGSEWVHLQFHMVLFELVAGDWTAAYERFMRDILPVAATTDLALTDAPALAWRLALATPMPVDLGWERLRQTALQQIGRSMTPFLELHNLLALAGAGDRESIDGWLRNARSRSVRPFAMLLLEDTAVALIAWCDGDYGHAARVLNAVLPRLPRIGGSHAQNQLFVEVARVANVRAQAAEIAAAYPIAA